MVLVVKKLPASEGGRNRRPIPGSGRPPGGGHGNPPQYSCLEDPTDRGASRATVHRVAESDATEATPQQQQCMRAHGEELVAWGPVGDRDGRGDRVVVVAGMVVG